MCLHHCLQPVLDGHHAAPVRFFGFPQLVLLQQHPSLRAGNSLADVPQETQQEGYYLCDEGGRLAVYSCTADGTPRQRLELTDIYVNLLPEQDALRFKAGYLVWSRQELETLLEDLGA